MWDPAICMCCLCILFISGWGQNTWYPKPTYSFLAYCWSLFVTIPVEHMFLITKIKSFYYLIFKVCLDHKIEKTDHTRQHQTAPCIMVDKKLTRKICTLDPIYLVCATSTLCQETSLLLNGHSQATIATRL